MKEEIKIIDGTYKKDNPHKDIGKQKFRVKKFYNVEVDYEVVANSKEEAEDAVQEHGGIEKIECQDGYYGDEPVECQGYDHNWDQQAETEYEKYGVIVGKIVDGVQTIENSSQITPKLEVDA